MTGALLFFLLLLSLHGRPATGEAPPWPCLQNGVQCQALLDSANNATASADIQTYCRETEAYMECLNADLADCDSQTLALVQASYLDNVQLSLTTVCGRMEQFECLQNWTTCEELFTEQSQFLNAGDFANYCRVGEEYLTCMEDDLLDCDNQTEALHRRNYVTGVQDSMNITCNGQSAVTQGSSLPNECASALAACLTNVSTADITELSSYCVVLHGAVTCILGLLDTCTYPSVENTLHSYQELISQLCVENGEAQCDIRWSHCAEPLLPVINNFDINTSTDNSLLCLSLNNALTCMENNTVGCTSLILTESTASYRQMHQQLCGTDSTYQECYQELQQCQVAASVMNFANSQSMCSVARQSLRCLHSVLERCPGFVNISAHQEAVSQICSAANSQCAATYPCFQTLSTKIQTQSLRIACQGYSETLVCLEEALQSCHWHYNSTLNFSQLAALFNSTCSVLTPAYTCPLVARCISSIQPMTALEDNYRPLSWCRLLSEGMNCSLWGTRECNVSHSYTSQLQSADAALRHTCSRVLPSETWSPSNGTVDPIPVTDRARSSSTDTVLDTVPLSTTASLTTPTATPTVALSSRGPSQATASAASSRPNGSQENTSVPGADPHDASDILTGKIWLWLIAVSAALQNLP